VRRQAWLENATAKAVAHGAVASHPRVSREGLDTAARARKALLLTYSADPNASLATAAAARGPFPSSSPFKGAPMGRVPQRRSRSVSPGRARADGSSPAATAASSRPSTAGSASARSSRSRSHSRRSRSTTSARDRGVRRAVRRVDARYFSEHAAQHAGRERLAQALVWQDVERLEQKISRNVRALNAFYTDQIAALKSERVSVASRKRAQLEAIRGLQKDIREHQQRISTVTPPTAPVQHRPWLTLFSLPFPSFCRCWGRSWTIATRTTASRSSPKCHTTRLYPRGSRRPIHMSTPPNC
jgi:hypothetical protein